MQRVVLDGVEPGSVVRAVDARTYARGVLFAQRRAVAEMEWDGEHNALYTEVRDSGAVHEAVAYFRVRRAALDFVFGECTCPAGMRCVHMVASVLAAADTAGVGRTGTAGAYPPWERTLRSLFAPDPPSLDDLREPVPLAVELSLSAGHARSVALSARIVRPGRTGWVGGGLSWRNVASPYSLGDYVPVHARVLRELYALHSAGGRPTGYSYGGYDRVIDLAAVGRGLWSVLDEAADVGLQFVHARKRFGPVDRYGRAELCLDVTAGPAAEALEIAPALRLDGAEEVDADALPVLFLGSDGHGVVHVSRAQARADADPAHWRFRLDRLASPASPPLRRLATQDGGLSVPAEQRGRFLDEFYPRLRRLAPVASSDASFTPPAVVLPELVLHAAPGLFPSPTRFREMYARPVERDRDAEVLARLRRRIRPLMRRRTKEQVAPELPRKQEQELVVELDARHRRIYERHLQRERQKVLGLIDDVDRNRFTILRSITLLRRLSLHPGLIAEEHAQLGSAKIETLLEQLSEVVDGGHRALVFSQFTSFLALVRERLDAAGVAYCYLDGSSRDRAAIVARFRDGTAPVFLISLKAGGFGMNLTEADYCFLLDPWWNPATEAQAVDRTHRIGQTRNVMVYRLIARDTIEEKMLALAKRKAALFAGVMDDGGSFGTALTADDIRALVS